MTFRSQLDNLPLFASDMEIAIAIVGKKRAKKWKETRLPTLEGKAGFPPIDPFHEGRPVPLVKRFYESYLGLSARGGLRPDGAENPEVWKNRRRERHSQ
ncbi:hypothetical protein X755_29555 [Mesorhizobium sp. LNJC405B00]|nr:hypothetical protein X755_29555 [Mesorhizobium sp. LNJC405B00]